MKKAFLKIGKFLLGILILLAFISIDLFISSIPFWLIEPKSYCELGVSIMCGLIIFFAILITAVLMMARSLKNQISEE